MKYLLYFLLFILIPASPLLAQDQDDVDSMLHIIDTSESNILKAKHLYALGVLYINSEPDTALHYINIAIEHAEADAYLEGIADGYGYLGYIYLKKGLVEEALNNFYECLTQQEKLQDTASVAATLNNIGYVHKVLGNIEEAIDHFERSLKLKRSLSDTTSNHVKLSFASTLNNIGTIYDDAGDTVNAFNYYRESLELRSQARDTAAMANSLNNIGYVFHKLNELDSALAYFSLSYKYGLITEDFHVVAYSTKNIGDIYLLKEELAEAHRYAKLSMDYCIKMGYPGDIKDAALLLSKIYKVQGDYENALISYEFFITNRDSMLNESNQKVSIRQQTKYEFEKAQLVKEQGEQEAARVLAEETSRRDNLQYSVIFISLLVIGGLLAVIGRFSIPERVAEGLIFFAFLLFFEFLLVLADPYIEGWSGGAPGIKLLFNAGIAALIFPAHAFFETKLKGRLVKN